MKNKSSYLLFGLTLFLGVLIEGCSDEEETEVIEPTPELLLKTNLFHNSGCRNCYAFVSDLEGKVLDVQEIDPDKSFMEFYGVTDGPVTLTNSSLIPQGAVDKIHDRYDFRSRQGIPKGTSLLRVINEEIGEGVNHDYMGNASYTIENYDDSSDPRYSLGFSDGSGRDIELMIDFLNTTYDGSTYSGQLKLNEGQNDILISTYYDGKPMHKWVEGLIVGDEINVDFTSFELSKTISLNKFVHAGYVLTHVIDQDYLTSFRLSDIEYWKLSESSSKDIIPQLGYIEGFEDYLTYVLERKTVKGESNSIYRMFGEVPSSIELPDYELLVANTGIDNFSFDFSNKYTYQESLFVGGANDDINVFWNLHSPESVKVAIPEIPEEILEQYLTLSLENTELRSLSIYDHNGDYSYLDRLVNKSWDIPGSSNELYGYFVEY